MNTISVIPVGGLCNRMRVISSSISVAKELGAKRCEIYWNNNEDCSADFRDLFLPINLEDVEVIENHSLKHKEPSRDNLQIPRIIQNLTYGQVIRGFNVYTDGDVLKKIRTERNLLIYTCHSIYQHYPLNKLFVPCAEIEKKINKITSSFNSNTIGLHIRRTDHAKAIELSPLSFFVNLIDEEIQKNEETTFYLATDDKEIKKELVSKYQSKIIYFDGELSRVSKNGMENAVVDLFALSKTNKIIGSAASSYSALAAELGNIPLLTKK